MGIAKKVSKTFLLSGQYLSFRKNLYPKAWLTLAALTED
jgi:hypothetical protein